MWRTLPPVLVLLDANWDVSKVTGYSRFKSVIRIGYSFIRCQFRQVFASPLGNLCGLLTSRVKVSSPPGEWQEALLHYYSLASFLGCVLLVLRLGKAGGAMAAGFSGNEPSLLADHGNQW